MRNRAREIGRWLRQGLPALALYALVLQAFLTGAAPAAPFDPAGVPLCSEMAAGGAHPSPTHPGSHEHDCLCLAQCAAPHAPAAILGGAAFPSFLRHAQLSAPARAGDEPVSARPIERGPGARAPPRL